MLVLVGLVWLYQFRYESRFRHLLEPRRFAWGWRWAWCFTCASAPRVAARSSTSSSNMSIQEANLPSVSTSAPAAGHSVPFGVNAIRLGRRQWLIVAAIVLGCFLGIPRLWKRIERFDTGPDYRIPYALSDDYWLFERRLQGITDPTSVPVLGDSVVWGEYVRHEGTLTGCSMGKVTVTLAKAIWHV